MPSVVKLMHRENCETYLEIETIVDGHSNILKFCGHLYRHILDIPPPPLTGINRLRDHFARVCICVCSRTPAPYYDPFRRVCTVNGIVFLYRRDLKMQLEKQLKTKHDEMETMKVRTRVKEVRCWDLYYCNRARTTYCTSG